MKHLLFNDESNPASISSLNVSHALRLRTLSLALADIIWRCGDQTCATVAMLSPVKHFQSFGKYVSDGVTEYVTFTSVATLKQLRVRLICYFKYISLYISDKPQFIDY